MYQKIYNAYLNLSKGDQATLKHCNFKVLASSPAYFRILKYSNCEDCIQTQRILFLMVGIDISNDAEATRVAKSLLKAGVKESHMIQITRNGDNALEYLKRLLVKCKQVQLNSLGELAQYWGDTTRRDLLKNFILADLD